MATYRMGMDGISPLTMAAMGFGEFPKQFWEVMVG